MYTITKCPLWHFVLFLPPTLLAFYLLNGRLLWSMTVHFRTNVNFEDRPLSKKDFEILRYDAFIEAQEFESNLITNSLPTEQLTLLLITIALAVGGLIYFCINLVRIFPGTSKIGHKTDNREFWIQIPELNIFIQKEVFQDYRWMSANHLERFSLINENQWFQTNQNQLFIGNESQLFEVSGINESFLNACFLLRIFAINKTNI